mgnify:CR=1 FL=1
MIINYQFFLLGNVYGAGAPYIASDKSIFSNSLVLISLVVAISFKIFNQFRGKNYMKEFYKEKIKTVFGSENAYKKAVVK